MQECRRSNGSNQVFAKGHRRTKPLQLTGPASRLVETQRRCSRPGNLSESFGGGGRTRENAVHILSNVWIPRATPFPK